MTSPLYDIDAEKKATNLSINADLLRQARALKLNLSRELEQHLLLVLKQRRAEQWREENRQAIDDYNARIERDGAFSDGVRSF